MNMFYFSCRRDATPFRGGDILVPRAEELGPKEEVRLQAVLLRRRSQGRHGERMHGEAESARATLQ